MRNELRVVVAGGAALAVSLSADAADTSSNNVGFPIYKDGVLTIPRVDTAEQLGQYQDVSFRIQGGTWQLLAYKSLEAISDSDRHTSTRCCWRGRGFAGSDHPSRERLPASTLVVASDRSINAATQTTIP